MLKQLTAISVSALLTFAFAHAQETRGSIRGRITDPSGAVVPNAAVAAIHTETNASVTTRSNNDGDYALHLLLPGHYVVTAAASGFKTHRREGLELRIHEALRIDLALELGAASESVKVTSETPVLEVSSTSLGMVMDSRRIAGLPLIGGSPIALMYLSPGATNTAVGANNVQSQGGIAPTSSNMSVNGSPLGTTDFAIDGIPNSQTANVNQAANSGYGVGVASSPPADLVQEFKMETAFDASVGHSSGAVMNLVLKSGANQPHGTGYWFHQSPDWNANSFFANMQGQPKQNFQFNRWGSTLTGPVFLPRLFDGRNKLFFAFGYEGYSAVNPYSYTGTVPTAEQAKGDFSALLRLGPQYQIYDPATAAPAAGGQVMRQPLAGNVIPASRISPIAQKVLPFYPAPTTAGTADGQNNYAVSNRAMPEDYATFIGRLDYNFSDRQRAYFRVSQMHRFIGPYRDNFDGPGSGETFRVDMTQFAVDDVYTLNPTTVLNFRYGYNRYPGDHGPRLLGFDAATLGFAPNTVAQFKGVLNMLPEVQVASLAALGNENADYNTSDVHAAFASLNKVIGKHTLKIGSDIRAYRSSQYAYGRAGGSFTFNSAYTQGPLSNSPSAPVGIGQGLAALLLGLPTTGRVDRNDSQAVQSTYWAVYFHDNWRLLKNLTLDLGLRWEYEGPATERYNRSVAGFDPTAQLKITQAAQSAFAARPAPAPAQGQFRAAGGLLYAGTNGMPREFWDRSYAGFAPRFGIAWQPFNRMAVRGGFGLYFIPVGVPGLDAAILTGFNQATPLVSTLDNGLTFVGNLTNPFPGGLNAASGSSLGVNTFLGQSISFYDRNVAKPYTLHWDLNVQRLLPSQILLEVGYNGSKTNKMWLQHNSSAVPNSYLSKLPVRDAATIGFLTASVPNPFANLLPGTNLNGATIAQNQLLGAYPQFIGVTEYSSQGYSWYHSMRVQVQRRFHHGVTMNLAYVWSKQMDAMVYLNGADPVPNRSISPNDRPHRLNLNGIVELPMGHFGRALNLLARGWSVATIWQLASGPPLGFGNALLTGSFDSIYLPPGERSIYKWFNTGTFNRVAAQQLANNVITFPRLLAGLRGDMINQWDASVLKHTRFGERFDVEFRAEFFNVFNHPNQFAPPNTAPTSTAFGTVTSVLANPRNIQMGMKLRF